MQEYVFYNMVDRNLICTCTFVHTCISRSFDRLSDESRGCPRDADSIPRSDSLFMIDDVYVLPRSVRALR